MGSSAVIFSSYKVLLRGITFCTRRPIDDAASVFNWSPPRFAQPCGYSTPLTTESLSGRSNRGLCHSHYAISSLALAEDSTVITPHRAIFS